MKRYAVILIGIWMMGCISGFAQEEFNITTIEDFVNGPTGWLPLINEPNKQVSIQAFTDDRFPKGAAEIFLDSTGYTYLAIAKQTSGLPLDAKYITLWVKGTGKKEEVQFVLSTSENKNYSSLIKLDDPSWHRVKLPVSGFAPTHIRLINPSMHGFKSPASAPTSKDTKEPLPVHLVNGMGFVQMPKSEQKNFWVAQIRVEGKSLKEVEQEDKARACYDQGLKLYEQKKYDLAFAQWDNAVILDPKNEQMGKEIAARKIVIYRENGMKFYEEGKITLAAREWEKAIELDPGNKEIRELINEAEAPPVAVIDDFENEIKFVKRWDKHGISEGGWAFRSDQGKKIWIRRITDEKFPGGAAEIYLDRIEEGNLAITRFFSQTIWGKDMDRLTLWVKGDGSDNNVTVSLVTPPDEAGQQKIYASSISMKDTAWHKVSLKFTNFTPVNTREPLIIKDINSLSFSQKIKSPPIKFQVVQIHVEMKSARESRIENEVREYYNTGLELYKEGKYASAVAEWEKVLALEPDNQKIRTLVQEAKQKVGTTFDEKRAQASYDKGLDAYNKENYKSAQDSLNEAIAFWTKVVESDPQNVQASQNLKSAKHLLRKIEVENEVRLHIQKEQDFLKNKDFKSAVAEFSLIDILCQSILRDEPNEEKISKLQKEAAGYVATISAEMEAEKSLEKVRDYYKKRQIAEASMEVNQAISRWNLILEKEPSNTRANEGLARAKKLAELINLEKEIWVRLGKLSSYQGKNYSVLLQEHTEINSLCLKVLEIDSTILRIVDMKNKLAQKVEQLKLEKNAGEHYDSGFKLYGKGNYSSSIQEFEKAIQIWKEVLKYDPQARRPAEGIQSAKFQIEKMNLEGEIKTHQNKGQEFQAKEDYEKAINEYESANTLCLRILSLERENKKIQDLRLQIQCSLSFVKGISFYKNGKYAEAILEWKQVLSLNPKYPDVQSWIDKTTQKEKKKAEVDVVNKQTFESGMKYYNQKEYTKAIAELKKVIARDPGYPEVQLWYKKAMEKLITEKEAKLAKAREYNKNGDLAKAVREWRSVLRMDPSDKEANEYLQKLKTQITQKAEALYLEGINYYMKENLEKAISIWEDVLILDPGNEKAQKNIEKAKAKLKK